MQSACDTPYCHLWPDWLAHIFPDYLINGKIFGRKVIAYKNVLIFCTTCVWNISHSRKNSAGYYHNCTYDFTYSFHILLELPIFSKDFQKNTQISNFIKIRSVGAELSMQTGGQTHTTKLIVAFRNFASAPKSYWTNFARKLARYSVQCPPTNSAAM